MKKYVKSIERLQRSVRDIESYLDDRRRDTSELGVKIKYNNAEISRGEADLADYKAAIKKLGG